MEEALQTKRTNELTEYITHDVNIHTYRKKELHT